LLLETSRPRLIPGPKHIASLSARDITSAVAGTSSILSINPLFYFLTLVTIVLGLKEET
jgi:hypothetical protein